MESFKIRISFILRAFHTIDKKIAVFYMKMYLEKTDLIRYNSNVGFMKLLTFFFHKM